MIRTGEIDINEIILKIENKNFFEKSALFIWGVLIYAISFSLFFSPRNIVTGGSTGLSIIANEILNIDMSLFVFIFSLITLIIGYKLLGKYVTAKTICGVIILPIFMKFASIFPQFLNIQHSSLFLTVFFGGLLMGLGNGIIIRSGFSVGGFQTIYQILYKYKGISIGKSSLFINSILILIGSYFFGISNSLYAIIGLYVSSVVTDRVMLETSITKTFLIVTKKSKRITQYITDNLSHSCTVLNAKGGRNNDDKKIIMFAVPTRQYYQAKQIIKEIDQDAFFLIMDTYEIYGGM